ncbi:TonB-dependent receptor [Cryomorphaceae bacterium]|nr:TonB-dependent receptor [Cryomorphaceae bacterium]
MRYGVIYLLSFLLLPFLGRTQSITGTVEDAQTGERLAGANIRVLEFEYGTATDAQGNFKIDLSPASYDVEISFIGYEPRIFNDLEVTSNGLELTVKLKPQNEFLSAVTVTAGKFDQRLDEVTVSMDILSPRLINEKNTYEIQSVLEQSSGVSIIEDQANIRGGSGWSYGAGTRVQVLIDDLPVIDGGSGQVQWKSVPTELVDQIEIIKGASSALYGSSALNGVINVRTKRPSDTLVTELTLFTGAYGKAPREELQWWDGLQTVSGVNWSTSWSSGADGFIIGGHALRDDGYEYKIEDHRIRLEGAWHHSNTQSPWSYGISSNINYRKSGDALIWDSEENGYVPLDSSNTVTEANFYYIDPYISWKKNRWSHQFKARFMSNINTSRSLSNSYDNFYRTNYTEYQGQYFVNEDIAFTGGIVNNWASTDAEIFQGEHSTYNLAAYLQLDKKFGKLKFSLGGRYEYFRLDDETFQRPVLRSGINYAISSGTSVRASFGQGYRFPTIAEKYILTNVGGVYIYPSEDLQPESGWSAEIGVKQGIRLGRFLGFVDVAGFWMRYNDMMEFTFGRWAEISDINKFFGLGFKSINIGTTDIRGFELSTGLEYRQGKSRWQLMGGYTYMDPQIANPNEVYATGFPIGELWPDSLTYANTSSDTSGVLKYRYQHLLKLDLQFDYGPWTFGASTRLNDFMANIDLIFESELFALQAPGISESRARLNNGDILWDFRVGYSFNDNLQIRGIIENAFNREVIIRPAKIGPPVQYTLQLQARF